MNTATTLLNGATVTAAAENRAGAAAVDLNAITVNDVVYEVTVVNGSTPPGQGRYLDVYLAYGTASTSSGIPDTYEATAERIRVLLSGVASATKVYVTDARIKKARYAYVWYSHEPFDAAVTLTLKLVS